MSLGLHLLHPGPGEALNACDELGQRLAHHLARQCVIGRPAIGAAGAPPVAPVPPASTPPCDGVSFEEAERVQGLGLGAAQLWAPALSSDGSTLYFAAASPGVPERIYAATRSQRGRRFSAARLVAGVDSGAGDGTPLPSHDGLRLYFYSRRSGGSGERKRFVRRYPTP